MMEEFTTFEQAYGRYYPAIYHFFFKYYHHHQSAEDATQEVFCRAWRYRHLLEEITIKWFYRIAQNYLTDQWRRTRNVEWCELSDEIAAVIEDDCADWQESEMELRLTSSMRGLTEECQVALRMDIAGYSLNEIAQRLHKSLPAIKMTIYRAKKCIASRWTEQEQEVA
jgi:RNA polymerase sigma-70 factor (ECF subfamily)